MTKFRKEVPEVVGKPAKYSRTIRTGWGVTATSAAAILLHFLGPYMGHPGLVPEEVNWMAWSGLLLGPAFVRLRYKTTQPIDRS